MEEYKWVRKHVEYIEEQLLDMKKHDDKLY